jgi:4-amino-4-deoxy-L-arabinose transferase-like glycosyltransferase
MVKKLQLIKNYSPLFISIFIFIFLLLPYLGSLPYLDGAIDLVQINDYFSGGFAQLFNNWGSIHPPFKVILGSISFSIFGVNTIAYSIIGIIFGIIALIAMWVLVNKLFNKKVAIISVLLLSTAPLFLVNSLFAMTDYLLACMILLSLTFYIYNKRILLALTFCICVMIKETALLLPCAFLVVEIFFTLNNWHFKKARFHWKSILLGLLPAVLPLLFFLVGFSS